MGGQAHKKLRFDALKNTKAEGSTADQILHRPGGKIGFHSSDLRLILGTTLYTVFGELDLILGHHDVSAINVPSQTCGLPLISNSRKEKGG